MHFDEGNAHRRKGIAKGDAGMRKCCRIDDDVSSFVAFRSMYPLNKGGFRIALEAPDLEAELLALVHKAPVDRLEGVLAIVVGLPVPKEVQVGAVEDQDLGHGRRVCRISNPNVQFSPNIATAVGMAARLRHESSFAPARFQDLYCF